MLRTYFIMSLLFSALAGTMFFGIVQAELSPPEFTVKPVAHPYDVPPTTTTTIDQYTGEEIVTTTPGYHVENKSIEITITNQPFTPYTDAEGHLINLYYNVRFKGHFGQESDWQQPYNTTIRNGIYGTTKQIPQSSSEYTVISYPSEFQVGDVVDFQVQTLEGFYTPWEPLPMPIGASQFTGKSNDWSNIQTITISASGSSSSSGSSSQSSTPDQTTEPTPNQTMDSTINDTSQTLLLGIIIGIVVTFVSLGAGLLVFFKKRKRVGD